MKRFEIIDENGHFGSFVGVNPLIRGNNFVCPYISSYAKSEQSTEAFPRKSVADAQTELNL